MVSPLNPFHGPSSEQSDAPIPYERHQDNLNIDLMQHARRRREITTTGKLNVQEMSDFCWKIFHSSDMAK